ncbi:hypothetical protein ACIOGZ_08100 [Kitasatospora sp. NPDC088160]|uniref:hypothetical protein n=1 Tax=Kitasatospora sp. NPDC088160 TaxID=3364072 RepID=UPI0038268B90
MPEQNPEPTDEQKNDERPETPAASPEDDLPDWARRELSRTRAESASYRTRLRDAEERLTAAKSPEEFEAAVAEVTAKNAELERTLMIGTVARRYDLPDALAARLRGATVEELDADAKTLQGLLVPPLPQSLDGGLDPSSQDDGELDPRKLARRTRRF